MNGHQRENWLPSREAARPRVSVGFSGTFLAGAHWIPAEYVNEWTEVMTGFMPECRALRQRNCTANFRLREKRM